MVEHEFVFSNYCFFFLLKLLVRSEVRENAWACSSVG